MAQNSVARTKPDAPYIVVDGACECNPGLGEYQGFLIEKHDAGKKITHLFKVGPLAKSTNNLVEFLAVVHGLAHCQKHGLDLKVYSDSHTAITWVRKRAINSTMRWDHSNKQLRDLCRRAIVWLNDHPEAHLNVLKWETKYWGENPADFGNKVYKR